MRPTNYHPHPLNNVLATLLLLRLIFCCLKYLHPSTLSYPTLIWDRIPFVSSSQSSEGTEVAPVFLRIPNLLLVNVKLSTAGLDVDWFLSTMAIHIFLALLENFTEGRSSGVNLLFDGEKPTIDQPLN